ncbi:MAG: TylF/MycF/NovP-related O-methyltransferase [Rhodospirillaceae bacterium]|jgi:hypothetical protein|nr:TylF/MycF/NovP-related O-methyltransferase [Rhodospirillaceae bacterium]
MSEKINPEFLNQMQIYEALALGVLYSFNAHVDGHIAEFGTNTGRTAQWIAASMHEYEQRLQSKGLELNDIKSLHLFDSFQGMPEAQHEADKASPDVVNGTWGAGALKTMSADKLYSTVSKIIDAKKVLVFEGFYSTTLPMIPNESRYSMIHMDSTLYLSTFEVLDYLFGHGHVAEGALILFKGWNANRARNSVGERRAWLEVGEKYDIIPSDPAYFAWQGVKFFIHGYRGMPSS